MSRPGPIETERLRLIPVTAAHVQALRQSRAALAMVLGAEVPGDRPVGKPGAGGGVNSEVISFLSGQTRAGSWPVFFYIHRADNKLVGDGGFKGKPDRKGAIEIGYALVPPYRGQGLAAEAARAIVDWAFSHPKIKAVTAETLLSGKASMRLLQRLGLSFKEQGFDPAEGEVYRWEIARADYESRHARAIQVPAGN
jgi:[ribosomal protein S5]-alanine N-acetyltransferase